MTTNFSNLFYRAGTVFTPAAPVDKKALFAGRLNQLSRVIDTINTKGQHAIVYGERGAGKTSLANIIHETLEPIGLGDVMVNRINCDSTDSFGSVWKKALKEIVYVAKSNTVGFEPETRQTAFDLSMGLGDDAVPDDVCRVLKRIGGSTVFIFDEFDRLTDSQALLLFSDTMKSLSDSRIDSTLVLVGVADNVEDLIKGHESIVRSLRQIRVPKMSEQELHEIIDKACEQLGCEITEEATARLLRHSQGLPHYMHLLGLDSSRNAFNRQSLEITLEDVKAALQVAMENAQQSVLSAYQRATSSSHQGHLFRQVLLACALASKDELGHFGAPDVREPLSKIMNRKYDITAFAVHLNKFCSDERGQVLEKTGIKRRFRYRFKDPLLPPFVIIRGFADGFLSDDQLNIIPLWVT